MKIEIKCRCSGRILFEHTQEGNTLRITLEAAVKAGANLEGASLTCANLTCAHLEGAHLEGAHLAGAHLEGAYLKGENLAGASLARANLTCAHLEGAHLARANLEGANLTGANLTGANLTCANLAGANLAGAHLEGAYLAGARLEGAYLKGAHLARGVSLKGGRPIFQIGPIGSRCAYFVAYITTQGVLVSAGCFKQKTIAEFRAKLAEEHGSNKHADEYEAALTLIEKHAEIWG